MAGAAALVSSSASVFADDDDTPNNPFIVLLRGCIRPCQQVTGQLTTSV
jgi:hypothetical protein